MTRCMSSSERTMMVKAFVNLQYPALILKSGSNVDVSHLKIGDPRLPLQNYKQRVVPTSSGSESRFFYGFEEKNE